MYIALKGHSFYNIAIFDLEVILLLQCVSTQIAQQFGWRSQNGGHTGFPIVKILAIFHLHINLLLHCKFQLNSPCGLRDVHNRFSIWRLWRPSWISDRHDLAHFDQEAVLLLQSKFWLKFTKGLGRDVDN